MANRFTDYESKPYVSTYVPLPIDMMAKVLSEKQGQYDKAEQERLEILGKQTNRLQADASRLQAAKSEVDKKLEEFSNKDLTDPTIKADWYKTKRDIVNRYGPQGDIGSMQSNYDAHKEYMKGLKAKLEKGPKEGGIDLDTYNKLASISLDQYKGIGSDTGEGYNQYKGIDAAGYVDIVDQADKLGKDWKANAIFRGGYNDVDGRFIKKSIEEIERTDPNEIYQHIKPQLMADPMNQAYAKQHVMLTTYGKDRFIGQDEAGNTIEYNPDYYKEKMYDDIFDKPAKFAAAKYGYSKRKQDQTWKESQGYLHAQRAKEQKLYEAPLTQTGSGAEVTGIASFKSNPAFAPYIKDDGSVDYSALDKSITSGVAPGFWSGVSNSLWQGLDYLNTGLGLQTIGLGKGNRERKGSVAIQAQSFKDNLRNLAEDRAKLIGYTGKVTPENYNDIFSQSEQFAKERGTSLEFSNKGERDAYTNKLNQTRESFSFSGADGGELTSDQKEIVNDPKNKFRPLSRLSRQRVDKDGNTVGSESVVKVADKDGNIFYAKEPGTEESHIFDKVFEVNNDGVNFIRTGKTQENFLAKNSYDKNRISSGVNEAITKAANQLGFGLGFKIAAINNSPVANGEYSVTVAPDAKNKRSQVIFRVVEENGKFHVETDGPLSSDDNEQRQPYLPVNTWMSSMHQNFILSPYGTSYRESIKPGYSEDRVAEEIDTDSE